MNFDEDINSMFTPLTIVTKELVHFENVCLKKEEAIKILRSPKAQSNIYTIVKEVHDLSGMTIKILQKKLLAHEMAMKDYESEEESKRRN